jgi:hypothetical protein
MPCIYLFIYLSSIPNGYLEGTHYLSLDKTNLNFLIKIHQFQSHATPLHWGIPKIMGPWPMALKGHHFKNA